jgi:hypothetical protein
MRSHRFLTHAASFTGRAVVFFFIVSALACFLYVLGNYQDFLDSTQALLLSTLRISLGLEIVSGVWLAGFLVCRAALRRPFILRAILLLLSLAACAALLVSLRFAQQWLQA